MIHILTSPQKLSGLSRAVVTFLPVSGLDVVAVIVQFICDSFERVIVQKIVVLC